MALNCNSNTHKEIQSTDKGNYRYKYKRQYKFSFHKSFFLVYDLKDN